MSTKSTTTSDVAPHFWSTGFRVWFWIQMCLLTFDASFVLLRPWSFADGPLGFMYPAFQLYATIDTVYADVSVTFGWAMSTATLIENILIAIALFVLYPKDQKKPLAVTTKYMQASDYLLFATVFMQASKTILYFLNDAYGGWGHVAHNNLIDLITMFVMPNIIWFIVPVMIMVNYFIPKVKATIAACDELGLKKD